jgi:Cu+-exporting ATPase
MVKYTSISFDCAYCGDACEQKEAIQLNQKWFCCFGCATLDGVVDGLADQVGEVELKYRQLDLPELFNKVVDFKNDSVYSIQISLPNIHCSSCIELLEDLPNLLDGVVRSEVNFEHKRCRVTAKRTLDLSLLAQTLDYIGYPPQISVAQKAREEERMNKKKALFKLAVAGFCFGNIMLFAMPHYFGMVLNNEVFFTRLFSGLSIVLSIPVLLYSGREYLTSAYKALSAGKAHLNIPIAIGMISLFGWSLYEILSGAGSGYLDSLAGLVFFLLIGKWFQSTVYDEVNYRRDLEEFIPMVVRTKAGASWEWKKLEDLETGDRIQVMGGEVVPVRAEVVNGVAEINYAFITGESDTVTVLPGKEVYAGGSQTGGTIELEIKEKPSLQQLWSTWSSGSPEKEMEDHWTQHLSKHFTIAVLSIASLSLITWAFIDPSRAIFVFSAVLIVACPCALALSAPFTYGNVSRVFSSNGFFLKQASSVGVLSRLNHLVFDKTGTLTRSGDLRVFFTGTLNEEEESRVQSLCLQSTHPHSRAISHQLKSDSAPLNVSDFQNIPGQGITGRVDGSALQLGSAEFVGQPEISGSGSHVHLVMNGKYKGYFTITPQYRPRLQTVLTRLGQWVNLSVFSGDNDSAKSYLQSLYAGFHKIRFYMKPEEKSEAIQQLTSRGVVAMVGDGMNDSSAIQQGDIGIAITETLNGFYPTSDAVLLGDSFEKLPAFVELGKYSKRVLKVSLIFSLLYNLTGLAFAVTGNLTPVIAAILMPLSSVSVVVLNTILIQHKARKQNLI